MLICSRGRLGAAGLAICSNLGSGKLGVFCFFPGPPPGAPRWLPDLLLAPASEPAFDDLADRTLADDMMHRKVLSDQGLKKRFWGAGCSQPKCLRMQQNCS